MSSFGDEFWAEILPEDWETDGYGIDSMLICPHGTTIEQDAPGCPDGCVNPLAGMI